jgi:hypothetical protein
MISLSRGRAFTRQQYPIGQLDKKAQPKTPIGPPLAALDPAVRAPPRPAPVAAAYLLRGQCVPGAAS